MCRLYRLYVYIQKYIYTSMILCTSIRYWIGQNFIREIGGKTLNHARKLCTLRKGIQY